MTKGKFPNNLRAIMERERIGPTELARRAHTNKQNIQRWADGERRLTPEWAARLAPHLGATVGQVLFAPGMVPKQTRAVREVTEIMEELQPEDQEVVARMVKGYKMMRVDAAAE